jgi:hypothetical protein
VAIIYKASLAPSKRELIQAWLDGQPWGGGGDVELIGSYRFDDPAGEVGVEAFLVRRGEQVLHVPLTYRAEPLAVGDTELIGTTEHSVLGTRWVYDGAHDPVAVSCFERALRGEQEQAVMEVWDGATLVERQDSTVRVRSEPGAHVPGSTMTDGGPAQVQISRALGADLVGDVQLIAEWGDGRAVVAALSLPRSTPGEP